jgi:hypothetical protein
MRKKEEEEEKVSTRWESLVRRPPRQAGREQRRHSSTGRAAGRSHLFTGERRGPSAEPEGRHGSGRRRRLARVTASRTFTITTRGQALGAAAAWTEAILGQRLMTRISPRRFRRCIGVLDPVRRGGVRFLLSDHVGSAEAGVSLDAWQNFRRALERTGWIRVKPGQPWGRRRVKQANEYTLAVPVAMYDAVVSPFKSGQ